MAFEKASSQRNLQAALNAHRELHGKLTDKDRNEIVARNVLHEELGYHSDGDQPRIYGLDTDTQDRLLTHGRQDAGHALLNTISLVEYQKWNRRLLVICVVLLIYIAWQIT